MIQVYDTFPEILAELSFIPLGLAISYLINYTLLININDIENIIYGPLCVTIAFAILIGGIQTIVKTVKKKYIFENLYILMIGMAFLIVGGCLMPYIEDMDSDEKLQLQPSYYTVAAGLGISYVPALSYINVRAVDNKYRTFKIALSHCWLIIGFAIGAIIQIEMQNYVTHYYGYILIAVATFILIGLTINVCLQCTLSGYNYRECLDPALDHENKFGVLMVRNWFETGDRTRILRYTDTGPAKKSILHNISCVLFFILSKATSMIYFYVPFLYVNSGLSKDNDLYYAYVIGIAGIIISTIFLIFTSTRTGFIMSCILKIIAIITFTVMMGVDGIGLTAPETKYVFWCSYAAFGFGYSHPDINILELVSFKWNEFILTLGFIIELAIVTIMQYLVHFDPEIVFGKDEHEFVLIHSIVFVVIFTLLGSVSIFLLPNTFDQSLLEIKNTSVGIKNEKKKQLTPRSRPSSFQQQQQSQIHYPYLNSFDQDYPPMKYNTLHDSYNSNVRPPMMEPITRLSLRSLRKPSTTDNRPPSQTSTQILAHPKPPPPEPMPDYPGFNDMLYSVQRREPKPDYLDSTNTTKNNTPISRPQNVKAQQLKTIPHQPPAPPPPPPPPASTIGSRRQSFSNNSFSDKKPVGILKKV